MPSVYGDLVFCATVIIRAGIEKARHRVVYTDYKVSSDVSGSKSLRVTVLYLIVIDAYNIQKQYI